MLLVSDDILFCGGLYIYILLVMMMMIFCLFCGGLYTIRPDVWGFLFLFFLMVYMMFR